MNWKVLLAGLLIIFTGFFVIFGFRVIGDQKRTQVTQVEYSNNKIIHSADKAEKLSQEAITADLYSQSTLIRGNVVNYNSQTKTITLALESPTIDRGIEVIGLVEVIADPKLLKDFSCWPESFKTSAGADIPLRTVNIPIEQTSVLYIKGETKLPIIELNDYLKSKPFIFALLNSSPTNANKLIDETSTIEPQLAKQLAILKCQK